MILDRTREQKHVGNYDYRWRSYTVSTGVYSAYNNVSLTFVDSSSKIMDIRPTSRYDSGVKPVIHNVARYHSNGNLASYMLDSNTEARFENCRATPGTGDAYTALGKFPFAFESPSSLSVDIGAYCANVTAGWTPLPMDVSLGNFVLELSEIRQLYSTWQNLWSRLLSLRPRHTRSGQDINDAVLSYFFGVRPLLSDMSAFVQLLRRTRNRLDFLRRSRNREVTLVHRSDLGNVWGEESPIAKPPPATQLVRVSGSYKHVIGAKQYHELEGLDDAFAYFRALLGSLGLNRPLTIGWEATRYSFVVDWFYNVGRVLENFQIPVFSGQYSIRNSWTSAKVVGRADVVSWPITSAGTQRRHLVGHWQVERYSRGPGIPITGVTTPTALQLALLASLGYGASRL